MLTKDERNLLENVLDALDRLYDGQTTVIDLHAILQATGIALRENPMEASIAAPLDALREVVRSTNSPDKKRDLALNITDDLRHFVAEKLREHELANPKQRHN